MKYKKIVYMWNLFRGEMSGYRFRSNQIGNIRWLFSLLKPVIADVAPLEQGLFDDSIDVSRIYADYGLPLNNGGFAKLIESKPNSHFQEDIGERFSDALVISFELPPLLRQCLEICDIPYIDIAIGPFRFLPDLSMLIRSNIGHVVNGLGRFSVSDTERFVYSGRVLAFMARRVKEEYPLNTILLIGQVGDDVSLIRNGKYIGYADFESQLMEHLRVAEKVLYKPHPYASRTHIIKEYMLLKRLAKKAGSKCIRTNINIYMLMAMESITKIVSLTSSASLEARFFNKEGVILGTYPFPIFGLNEYEMTSVVYVDIGNRLLHRDFWEFLLYGKDCNVAAISEVGILRNTLGRCWGMDFGLY